MRHEIGVAGACCFSFVNVCMCIWRDARDGSQLRKLLAKAFFFFLSQRPKLVCLTDDCFFFLFFFVFLHFFFGTQLKYAASRVEDTYQTAACFLLLAVMHLPQVSCLAIAAYEPSCTPVPPLDSLLSVLHEALRTEAYMLPT